MAEAPEDMEARDAKIIAEAQTDLIRLALKWADWCAGQGICAIKSEGVTAPEAFLMAYTDKTGDEDWHTIADRLTRQDPDIRRAVLEEAAETADREIRRAWARWIGSVDGGDLTVRLCLKSAHEMQNVPAAIRALVDKEAGNG